MKQFITIEKSNNLQALGFPAWEVYDISDLLAILPKSIHNINGDNYLNIIAARNRWIVIYQDRISCHELRRVSDRELVDALYNMIITLKNDCIL